MPWMVNPKRGRNCKTWVHPSPMARSARVRVRLCRVAAVPFSCCTDRSRPPTPTEGPSVPPLRSVVPGPQRGHVCLLQYWANVHVVTTAPHRASAALYRSTAKRHLSFTVPNQRLRCMSECNTRGRRPDRNTSPRSSPCTHPPPSPHPPNLVPPASPRGCDAGLGLARSATAFPAL